MAIPAPTLNTAQFPEKSLDDAFNKQTYLGNAFKSGVVSATLSSTAETPVLLISNPVGSGKTVFIYDRRGVPLSNSTVFRSYADSVISNPGTAITPVNLRVASSNASIATVYTAPTVATLGHVASLMAASAYQTASSTIMVILDPGHTLTITAQMNESSPGSYDLHVAWYELSI